MQSWYVYLLRFDWGHGNLTRSLQMVAVSLHLTQLWIPNHDKSTSQYDGMGQRFCFVAQLEILYLVLNEHPNGDKCDGKIPWKSRREASLLDSHPSGPVMNENCFDLRSHLGMVFCDSRDRFIKMMSYHELWGWDTIWHATCDVVKKTVLCLTEKLFVV